MHLLSPRDEEDVGDPGQVHAGGEATEEDLQKLERLAYQVKAGSLCGLGQTAPNPVLTTLRYFRDEYLAHIEGRCPARVCKPLIRYVIVADKCTGCTACAIFCPVKAISGERLRPPHVIDQEACIKCGTCYEVCRFNAIEVRTGGVSEMVRMRVNGKELEASEGKPLIEFLRENGEHVPGFCYSGELDPPYGSCRLCLVSTPRRVTTSCTLKPMEGLELKTLSEEVVSMRKTALELMLSDHYGDCIGPPCQDGCPAHSDVQGYLALIAMGKYHEAVKLMKEKYILPAVLGRVCPAFCEEACRRNLVDEPPLAIRQLKRFAADYDLEHGPPWMPEIPLPRESGSRLSEGGAPRVSPAPTT